MSKWFPSIVDAAREQFVANLESFLAANPGWTRASLLRTAGMDMSLIARIESGQGFSVTALDRLQRVMDKVVDGQIKAPVMPKKPPSRRLRPGESRRRKPGRKPAPSRKPAERDAWMPTPS